MVPRSLWVMSFLILSLAADNLWSQSGGSEGSESTSPASNIEGWHEEDEDEVTREWTWFGMSYEFRNMTIRPSHSIAVEISIKKTNGKK